MEFQYLFSFLVVLLYATMTCYAVQTGGTIANITAEGIASSELTSVSITSDTAARCLIQCSKIEKCLGFNMHEEGDNRVTCDLKQHLGFMTPMPSFRYVKVRNVAHSCAELYDVYGKTTSGVYDINITPTDNDPPNVVSVYCDMVTDGGKWMVLLRRVNGSVNFDRTWSDYRNQFGDLEGNLWMGLDFMYNVTVKMGLSYELRVDMVSFPRYVNGDFVGPIEQGYAKYRTFYVDGPDSFYRLTVYGFSGNWGDSMAAHNGMRFTASGTGNDHDRETDINCAEYFHAAWWYNACSAARLTGKYGMIVANITIGTTTYYQGIIWMSHLGMQEHPRFVEMKIRPILQ